MARKQRQSDLIVTSPPILVSRLDAAKLLGISVQFFSQLDKEGRVPACVAGFGRRHLWSVEELTDWIRAGCPYRVKWNELKNKT